MAGDFGGGADLRGMFGESDDFLVLEEDAIEVVLRENIGDFEFPRPILFVTLIY